jgi:hypothetical protein
MYLVVSHWEPLPGKEDEFLRIGREMSAFMRSQPGVVFLNGFVTPDGKHVAIHAYQDEATYRRLVSDDNSPMEQEAARRNMDEVARWLGSERGESIS